MNYRKRFLGPNIHRDLPTRLTLSALAFSLSISSSFITDIVECLDYDSFWSRFNSFNFSAAFLLMDGDKFWFSSSYYPNLFCGAVTSGFTVFASLNAGIFFKNSFIFSNILYSSDSESDVTSSSSLESNIYVFFVSKLANRIARNKLSSTMFPITYRTMKKQTAKYDSILLHSWNTW